MSRGSASTSLSREAMLLILTWAAGAVDALSYLGLGHVFTAMMTGNTVMLGLSLAQGEMLAALRSTLALMGFAVGVTLGALVVERDAGESEWPPQITAGLALEAIILAVFCGLWIWSHSSPGASNVYALIVLLGMSMGLQAAAVRRLGVPGIATTYITGTITSLFVDVVGWSRAGGAPPQGDGQTARWDQRVGLLAGVFVVYGLGALSGGLLQAHWPVFASAAPFAAVLIVVASAGRRYGLRLR
jgi:uncharacterized membrane protein YoaK (UPF0700 family)